MTSTLLHITSGEAWRDGVRHGRYEGDTLASEGFIHCSFPDQVLAVANTRFRGARGLVLLVIDSDRVACPIRHENLEGGADPFPHVYGPLNLDAVVEVRAFDPGPDGTFRGEWNRYERLESWPESRE